MQRRWQPGEVIVRREVLGLGAFAAPDPAPPWWGRAWQAIPVVVVEDEPDEPVTYIPPGAKLGFADGRWPTPDGLHPWHGRTHWQGHGCLMVQRTDESHAVWHFWTGPERTFACWYINLQAAFVRTSIGYDTQDHELDIVVSPDGSWVFKDLEVLDERVEEGRFTAELVASVRDLGDRLGAELTDGKQWWDRRWAAWEPDPSWDRPSLVEGWIDAG